MLFRRRCRRRVPGLNTTSTADISFILLAFFLMTSSMDPDKGLLSMLPAAEREEAEKTVDFKESDVLRVTLDAADTLRCNGVVVDAAMLREQVAAFVSTSTSENLILLSADSHTSYDAYFNMQHTVAAAYHDVRDEMANRMFGHGLADCSSGECDSVMTACPWRVAEVDDTSSEEKGGER